MAILIFFHGTVVRTVSSQHQQTVNHEWLSNLKLNNPCNSSNSESAVNDLTATTFLSSCDLKATVQISHLVDWWTNWKSWSVTNQMEQLSQELLQVNE